MRPFTNLSLLFGLLVFAACSNNLDDEEDCLDPSYKVPLTVTVNVDDSFHHHCSIDSAFSTRSADTPYLKYYVAAYPSNQTLKPVIGSSNTDKVSLSLHPGKYTMVGWVSYESAVENRCINFYTDDFDELLLKNKYSYTGAHKYKLAFRGAEDKNVAYNTTQASLSVTPAMALYRIVSTDTASYVPHRIVIKYTSSFPAAINALDGKINWWWNDISFESEPDDTLLASDYVFSQNIETQISLTIEIYDDNDKLRACKQNIVVPLINGGITTISGNFYSAHDFNGSADTSNGIKIKTEWDSSFEIEI